MKKALIAGAASAVLAAMPVVGVFAETSLGASVTHGGTLTDNFVLTIQRVCTIERTAHTKGDAQSNWSGFDLTAQPAVNQNTNTLAMGTLTAGAKYDMGSTTFKVICNGNQGYEVSATAQGFTGNTGDTNDNFAISTTAVADTPTVSSWNIEYTSADQTDTLIAANGSAFRTAAKTNNAGDTFTMVYTLGLKDGQASGSYNASVSYTLTDKTPTDGTN